MSNKDTKVAASVTENAVLEKDKRGFPFKKVVFVILVALVIISLILLVINLVINSYFSKVTVFDGDWEINTEKLNSMPIYQDNEAYFSKTEELHDAYDAVLLNYAQATSDMRTDANVYNYAIYGTDQFGDSENSSADIIMMVSANKNGDHATYLAFETKMLVYIPSVGVGPLSDAYYLGGPQLLTDTLSLNYGIQFDGFVELNMSAFVDIIDSFGSIEFKADKAFVDKVNEDIKLFNESKQLTGDAAATSVSLKQGKVLLDGKQTLAYLRNTGDNKSNVANQILSQLTTMIFENGFGGVKKTLDIALEETTVSIVREDVSALLKIVTSVFGSVNTVPVGNMEGRTKLTGIGGYVCDYQAERAAIVASLYCE